MTTPLKWLARRGMKELDLLFEDYLQNTYPQADLARQEAFVALLHYQDPRILDLLFGRITEPEPEIAALIAELKTRALVRRQLL